MGDKRLGENDMKIIPERIIHPLVEFTETEKMWVSRYLIREGYSELASEFRLNQSECRLDADGIRGAEQISYTQKRCVFRPLYGHYSGGRVFNLDKIMQFVNSHMAI